MAKTKATFIVEVMTQFEPVPDMMRRITHFTKGGLLRPEPTKRGSLAILLTGNSAEVVVR